MTVTNKPSAQEYHWSVMGKLHIVADRDVNTLCGIGRGTLTPFEEGHPWGHPEACRKCQRIYHARQQQRNNER